MSSLPSSSSGTGGGGGGGTTLSDLAVLEYLKARGYSSAYQALHSSMSSDGGGAPTAPLTRAVSGLLGGPSGQSLDASVDVVFWGLAKGSGRALVESFDRFFECVSETPDLLTLLALVFLHCNLQLLEVGSDNAALYEKYENYLAPVVPQVEEVKKVSDVSAFLKDLEGARQLRGQISAVEKEIAALSTSAAPALTTASAASIKATLHGRKDKLATLRATLQTHLENLAPYPYLTRLRAFRTIMTIPPASLSLLETHLRHPALSPIAAIITTRFVLGAGTSPSHCLEDSLDPSGHRHDPRIRWGHGGQGAALPDFDDDFNSGILKGQRFMASLARDAEVKSRARKGAEAADPFAPTVCAFQVTPGKATVGKSGVSMSSDPATCVEISLPDARRVVAAVGETIYCYMLDNHPASFLEGHHAQPLIGHTGFVYSMSWMRDSRTLLSAGSDASVRLWDVSLQGYEGKESKRAGLNLAEYKGHVGPVTGCSFSPAGYYFATAGTDCTVRVWTTDRSECVRSLRGHTMAANGVSWHPNSNYVLSCAEDETARLWDVRSAGCVRVFSGFQNGADKGMSSPDGKYVVAADGRGKVRRWEVGTGRVVNDVRPEGTYCYSMECSGEGEAVMVGGDDGVEVWDAEGGGRKWHGDVGGTVMDLKLGTLGTVFAGTR